jgi:hypothetical protein
MKLFIYKILLCSSLLTSFSVLAQQDEVITFTDTEIVVNLTKGCGSKLNSCDLSSFGVNVQITGDARNQYTINSEIPIKEVTYKGEFFTSSCYYFGSWIGNRLQGSQYECNSSQKSQSFDPGPNQLIFATGKNIVPLTLKLDNGIPTHLKAGLGAMGNVLKSTYSGVLRNVVSFKNEIARSHRGHLDRFNKALEDGIKLLSEKDKNGQIVYSIVDFRVQENARLIVVFGTVINELLTDYDDVERLSNSIRSMRVLVSQLRDAYGWNRGLAGNVSKASSSLIEVVRLELQELASIKMAMGATDFKIYLDLLKVARTLQSKVDAARSGDMRAQRDIWELLELWNSQAWQSELGRLINAGPDFKNLVLPKVSMLLYAIESIEDLTDAGFMLTDRATLK